MEKQLQDLLESVLKELSDLTKILKGSSKAIQANVNTSKLQLRDKKAYIQVLKDAKAKQDQLGISTTELSKTITEAEDNLEDFSKQAAKGTGVVGGIIGTLKTFGKALLSPATAAVKTGVAFSDVSNPISSMSDAISRGIDDIPVFGTIAKELAADFDAQRESFVQLAQTGASFNGSLTRLNRAAAEATIPLPKFVDLIASNSEVLGKLFGTVDRGVPQIAGLGARLRDLTETEFAGFGLTLDETSGFLATVLELERSRGNVQRMTQDQLITRTADYTKNLITLSKLTGKSVDELDKQQRAAAADGVFRAKLSQMGAKEQGVLTAIFGKLNPQLQQFLKEQIAFGVPVTELTQQLEVATGGNIGKTFQGIFTDLQAGLNADDILLNFENSLRTTSTNLMKDGGPFADLAILNGQFSEAFNALVTEVGATITKSDFEKTVERLSGEAENVVNVFSTFDKISSKAQLNRFELLFPTVLKATEGFNKVVGGFFEPGAGFDKFVQSVKDATDKLLGILNGEDGKGGETVLGKLSSAIENGIMKVKEVGGMLGEAVFAGEDGRNLADNVLDNYPTIPGIQVFKTKKLDAEAQRIKGEKNLTENVAAGQKQAEGLMEQFQTGTNGFMNFGRGTPAMLHGVEAVVPKNDFGQVLELFRDMLPGNNVATAPEPVQSGNLGGDMNRLIDTLSKGNEQVVNSLNNLISVNITTERNTAKTANTVANMSGSVI